MLNNKYLGWLFIFISTASKSLLSAVYTSYETDKSFYLLMGNNLSEGKGLTIPISFINNPSVTENIYLPSASSPLYSILVSPLLKIFPGNYFLVTWVMETASWLLLFIVAYKIMRKLLPGYFWANLFILFSGLFLYNIELSSSTKDVLSTALLLTALLQCLRLCSTSYKWPVILFSCLIFLLPGLTKSIYTPLAVVFPISIFFMGLISKQKPLLRTGLVCFAISLILLSVQYFYFHSLETRSFALYRDFFTKKWFMGKGGDDFITGFYLENLLRLYPFFPAALFNLDTVGVQVRDHVPSLYRTYGIFLYVANATGICSLVAGFFIVCKKYFRRLIPVDISFFITGSITSFAILAITCLLSLRFQAIEYKGSTDSWTFVYENRPYFFTIIFLQCCLFVFFFSKKNASAAWRNIKAVLAIIIVISCLHGLYFVCRNAINPAKMKTTVNQRITSRTKQLSKENPGKQVWLATEMPHLDWYAKLNHVHVLNRVPLLNDSSFQLPPATILLTAIAADDTTRLRNYISKPSVRLLENYDNSFLLFMEKKDGL